MDPTTAGLIGAAIGGILTATPTIVTFWLGKRSQEKQRLQQLALQTALESWRYHCAMAEKTGRGVMPLDCYLIGALKLVDLTRLKRLDADATRKHLQETFAVTDVAEEEIRAYNKKRETKHAT